MITGYLKIVAEGMLQVFEQSEICSILLYNLGFKAVEMKMGYRPMHRWLLFRNPEYLPLPRVNSPRTVRAKVELHEARRAGDHLDFRFVIDDVVYDYAVVKRTSFPQRGEVFRVVRRNNHSMKYFEVDSWTFGPGEYGEGEMNTVWRGEMDVIHSSPEKIEFQIYDGPYKGRYAILNLEEGSIMVRMKEPILVHKERMKFTADPKKLEAAKSDPAYIAEEKIDGANYILRSGEKGNTLVSRRLSVDGEPINRIDNIPQLRDWKIPEEFRGKDIHVEVVCRNGDSSETAGLLNSNPIRSRQAQFTKGKELVVYVWDIEMDAPYEQRRAACKRLAESSPTLNNTPYGSVLSRFFSYRKASGKLVRVPQSNEDTGETVSEFSERLKKEGKEGTVLKRRDCGYYEDEWIKDKKSETIKVKIVDFEPGTGRNRHRLGALIVETEDGQRTRVGSGFSDELREEIWNNKDEYRGTTVEVKCLEKTRKGAMRAPVFEKFEGS